MPLVTAENRRAQLFFNAAALYEGRGQREERKISLQRKTSPTLKLRENISSNSHQRTPFTFYRVAVMHTNVVHLLRLPKTNTSQVAAEGDAEQDPHLL